MLKKEALIGITYRFEKYNRGKTKLQCQQTLHEGKNLLAIYGTCTYGIMNDQNNDFSLWFISSVIDYITCGINVCIMYFGYSTHHNENYFWLRLFVLLVQGTLGTLLSIAREKLHYTILGSRVSKFKTNRKKRDPLESVIKHLKVIVLTMCGTFILENYGLLWLDDNFDLSFAFWEKVFLPFYSLLVLRDISYLGIIHNMMHSNKFPMLYKLHKKHHEITKNAESLDAYHITMFDLLIENSGAPLLLFLLQYQLGIKPGISWTSLTVFFRHDFGLHSVNPYSVMYFNPILDFMFKPNICHQLHHALNRDYTLFVPYGHILPSRRKRDEKKYNEVFKTTFSF